MMTELPPRITMDALLREMAPHGLGIGVADPTRGPATVWAEEAAAIAHAVPKRKREFAAGRRAARRAMVDAGVSPQAVPASVDRAPLWPAGLCGSISHDDRLCVALVAPQSRCRAIGVDIEPDARLEADVVAAICTPAEQTALNGMSMHRAGLVARRIFSAKEAVFKAQFPLTREMFDFETLSVELNALDTGFVARFTRDVGDIPQGTRVTGQCRAAGGHVLSLVTLGAMRGTENANFPVCATG